MRFRPNSGQRRRTAPVTELLSVFRNVSGPRYSRGMVMTVRVLCAALLLGLAGCSNSYSPPRPAMVSLGSVGDYGYSDMRLSDSRYEVRYVEPRLRVSTNRSDREIAIEAAKQRSYDLALWHAARLAVEKDYAALKVEQDHRDADVDVTTRSYRSYPPLMGYGWYGYPRPWFPYQYGYGAYPWYMDDPYVSRPSASARVSVRLIVKFEETADANSLDAAATIEQMRKRYAGASFPPKS